MVVVITALDVLFIILGYIRGDVPPNILTLLITMNTAIYAGYYSTSCLENKWGCGYNEPNGNSNNYSNLINSYRDSRIPDNESNEEPGDFTTIDPKFNRGDE
jgi:hypothetical protein